MDPQLQSLYTRLKARQMSPQEAAVQFKQWQAQHQSVPHEQPVTPAVVSADSDLRASVCAVLFQEAARVLAVDVQEIDGDVTLQEYGFDQLMMNDFLRKISDIYSLVLPAELWRECPTLHGLARYLVETFPVISPIPLLATSSHEAAGPAHEVPSAGTSTAVIEQFHDRAMHYFQQWLATTLKIPAQSLDVHATMEQYGMNSVLVMTLTEQLEQIFGSLPKTLFFEYQSIAELSTYFLEYHTEKLAELLTMTTRQPTPAPPAASIPEATAAATPSPIQHPTPRLQQRSSQNLSSTPLAGMFDVAIIGLSGRYPGADNVRQFWENLKAGRHCIREIPRERWDWRAYFDAEKGKLGSMYSRWGGFLSAIDTFDPLFFHISPAEAQSMDPQERLFIEEAYAAIEDAGYTPATLAEYGATTRRSERRIGVFVGVMNSTYSLNSHYWSIANRVSYLFDFQGPSLAVDTACSSSLSAIHLALESLYRGTCVCAIAGGVNLIVDPIHYLGLSALTMLSPGNQCKAFGDQADGFVDGEGVGVLVLKPLARAVEDNDHIYGVIKGSMINAGGKTHGYTVPNPRAQARVITEAWQQMGVHPRSISYIEAHGTGTALGDPIEIAGLTQAFRQSLDAAHAHTMQFCRIGSVKSNIGHLESAAGIAGVTKVLLQMQHGQLVPSLHAEVLNPGIDFANSPFVLQRQLTDWPRPQLEVDGTLREYPRLAGISSFGAGGANAHLLIAEYVEEATRVDPVLPALIVLSAQHATQLTERARQLLGVLQDDARVWADRDLPDMAYTLQVGRETMPERLALIVHSVTELIEKLTTFLAGHLDVPGLYRGRASATGPESLQHDLQMFAMDEDVQPVLQAWIAKGKYDRLLSLWVKGLPVNWEQLYGHGTAVRPRRLSLPTYPFARERYWAHSPTLNGNHAASSMTTAPVLHPFVHLNISDLTAQRFCSTFCGQEFFLADHLVHGQKILPAVAYLEMAREALQRAAGPLCVGPTQLRLENVLWMRPLTVGEAPVEVQIRVFPEASAPEALQTLRLVYDISSQDSSSTRLVYSQGTGLLGTAVEAPRLDLTSLRSQCDRSDLEAAFCYQAFAAMGIDYGSGHRGLQHVYLGDGQALARLALPEQFQYTENPFVLHPSLLDAALQAVLGVVAPAVTSPVANTSETPPAALPFALRELSITGTCTATMWAWVRYAEGVAPGHDFDIDLCDDHGVVCVRLRGLSLRLLERTEAQHTTLLLRPHWQDTVLPDTTPLVYARRLVALCEQGEASSASRALLAMAVAGVEYIDLSAGADGLDTMSLAERFSTCASRLLLSLQSLIREKPAGQVLLQVVLPAQGVQQLYTALLGLLKTASLEYPQLRCQLIEVAADETGHALVGKLEDNSRSPTASHIRYQDGKRQVRTWQTLPSAQDGIVMPWREQGTYLITGGAGGLGSVFAREIAGKTRQANIILTGRSPLDQGEAATRHQATMEALRALGARVEYRVVDVTQAAAVNRLIAEIQAEFGGLQGIVHSAGVLHDNFILKKTTAELHEVLAPKVQGLINLDHSTRDLALDCFLLCSSLAGAMGNPGQADYATANAFLDAYAAYRNSLVATQQRQGHTVSINWPFWRQGGMQLAPETIEAMRHSIGLEPLETADGLQAFYRAFASGQDQVVVVAGDPRRLTAVFLPPVAAPTPPPVAPVPTPVAATVSQDGWREKTAAYLARLIASVVGLPPHRLAVDASFEHYGMDSIMAMQLTAQLEKTFGPLSKTLFFEYHDILSLSDYFLASHRPQLQALLHFDHHAEPEVTAPAPFPRPQSQLRFVALQPSQVPVVTDIAVIGLAGRYPGANNLDEFWENLRAGRDCITEVPADRWEHAHYFDQDKNTPGKTYSKWGGFLEHVDCFDAQFFNISPRQAEIMDPQERLFLECVWHLLENAGHTRDLLRARYQTRVGVYVGSMYQPYHAFHTDLIRESAIAVSSYYSIANRVSHFFDFQGPSMAIDTACSSALVAMHMACESLRQGESRLAIAGGVNLSLHPKKYLGLSLAQIIGSHAHSRSFSDGDGYIPAEGVGAVLLKPLAQAVQDGDTILAVIKSTAVNHSGHTHGYAVPNPQAQAQLIIDNFRKAGINPRTISYVESAANGSALGDAIELNALHKAFGEFTRDQGFCTIGSVKSNIGHAEAASGISQLTKVILQLQHSLLVPSIQVESLNPNINFDHSPFVLRRELSEWRRPVIDGQGECPRRATISSFGAGGTNAHVIVEEYANARRDDHATNTITVTTPRHIDGAMGEPGTPAEAPQLVVVSTTSWQALGALAAQLVAFVQDHDTCSLASLAYTLQTKREPLSIRLAMVVRSRDELVQGLHAFVQAVQANRPVVAESLATSLPVFTADLEEVRPEIRSLLSGRAGEAIVQVFLAEQNLEKLALHWTQGGTVPWEVVHAGKTVRTLALPNYPFARQKFWLPEPVRNEATVAVATPVVSQETTDALATEMTPTEFTELPLYDKIAYFLTAVLAAELGLPQDTIQVHKNFQEYGADSIAMLKMIRGLEELLQTRVTGRDMLEHPTVASLARYLTTRLEQQNTAQAAVRESIQVSSAADRAATPGSAAVLLHHLFTAQASKTPERVAVVLQETCVTYAELAARSRRLATYLQQQGVGPETFVGLYMPRCLDMLVGVLGILQAGAAYVPLEPGLAVDRLDYIMHDAGLSLLLTHSSVVPQLGTLRTRHPRLQWIAVDSPWHELRQDRQQGLQDSVHGDNLAYMIYTSGSTGKPKGTMISHQSAARHCEVIREHWGITPEQRVLQFTPLSFDASVEQIFTTLSVGATLVLADPEALAPPAFSAMLTAHQITTLNIPPALALELLREWQRHPALLPATLRTLITGGDVLALEAVQIWHALLRDRVTLFNAYGPTETTITACIHQVTLPAETVTKIPIGRPFSTRRVHLLDDHGDATLPGVTGELVLGGMGLARGYWQRPALTATAFVPDPFATEAGARVYKTGDLGGFLPDGTIEFLGRLDYQVKIRGYRIELGEIEAVLATHPGVTQNAVVTVAAQDDVRLIGYVVARPGHVLEPPDLQQHLRQKLPEYMIPARFVVLEHMPLTVSGKIDRLRLPVPSQLDSQEGLLPRNAQEQQLARIWEELLHIRQPGIQDNFFTMGGHSILAIRLLARIRDQFGMELPLRALLQTPTIQGLAEMLRGDRRVLDFTHLVALQKGTQRPFFCVPGVGGTVFYFLKLASLLGPEQPFYGLQARGIDGETLPYSTVEDMARHYVQAIQTVQPQGPYLLGGHSFGGHVAFAMALELEAMGHEVGALVLIDCPAPDTLTLKQTWDVASLFLAFASILGVPITDSPALLCQMLGDLSTEAKLALVYDKVMQLDAFPFPVNMRQFQGLFQVYLLNNMMHYVPTGRLKTTPITLLAAHAPHSETLMSPQTFASLSRDASLIQKFTAISAAWAEYDRALQQLWVTDPHLGWGRFSTRPVEMRRVSGSHMNMIREPHVQELATCIKEALHTPPVSVESQHTQIVAVQPYPLSKVQEGLWLLQKFSPHMSAYNVPIAIRFTQGFDIDAFRHTCALLLDQYPILNSRFTEEHGALRQYIPAERQLAFEHQVIAPLDDHDLKRFLNAKARQSFDLGQGPLLRVCLVSYQRGQEQEHIALMTIHHIVFDGTSSILLASTLMRTYDALRRGEAPPPVMAEASYEDFVRWEQDMLAGPEGQEHLAWWQQHLRGELPVLAIRPDHPRPAVRGFAGATIEATLDPAISDQLKTLARLQRVSLSTLLLGIYNILLCRYSGQEDIIVGMPTLGRPKPIFDRVMGCFINMMAVRSQMTGAQPFVDYLKTLQLIVMDSLDHAVYPFSELVRELQLTRDQSLSPIFQTYFAYQNYITPGSADSQQVEAEHVLHAEFLSGIHQEGDKDLGLEVYERPQGFTLNLKYNPDLYEMSTAQRLLAHWMRLAAAVVQQPYSPIAAYDGFSAEERAALLQHWNNTARPVPQAHLLFQLFEAQAAKTPDHTAVVFQDQALTYAELDRRSSQLAAYLQQRGVRPETFVGLYMQRSLDIVVGAIGILKAGGVYVPLDPALPEERLAYMITDAGVAFLLTTSTLAAPARALASHDPAPELLCLDTDWPAIQRSGTVHQPAGLHPENLAYVIYTSGSTGRPKGVMIAHSTTIRHCYTIRDDFRITPGARVCLQSPISFDASIEQIFAPLSIGATIVIRDLQVLAPKPFSAMLADLQIYTIQLPPAFIQALFREWQLHPELIPSALQLLISCGDVLAIETVQLWQAMLKERFTLLNVYGPTEVTAKATLYEVAPELDTTSISRIPIGRPLANKALYILDAYLSPTPLGVPGELHIGGIGPGRGYHQRPALSAEKFIPDPFGDVPGARLYKTGDLAYYRDDGTIEFLGRIDHQVKVRGHRIELGEIEAVLAGHPGVKNVAVITVDTPQDRRIVAYLVAKDGYDLDQGDVKTFLARHLPDYMVPSVFVLLVQMPLTPSGKINRRALPLPASFSGKDPVAPHDPLEMQLVRIWEEVLEVKNPAVTQDFFALGGHSLLAIRLMTLMEERLGWELPLATLFQAPTIEKFAAVLRQRDASPEGTIVTLQSQGAKTPFFCVPGAGGTAFYLKELATHLDQERPFYALQAPGLDGHVQPYTSVLQIADLYLRALRTVQPQGPYVLGGHSFGGYVALAMTQALERMGQHVQQLVLLDCRAPHPDEPGPDWDDASLLIAFASTLGVDVSRDVALLASILAEPLLDSRLERILHAVRQQNRLLADTRMTQFKGLFQVFCANNRIHYSPDGPIHADIALFKASDFQPQVIAPEHFRQHFDDPAMLAAIAAMHRTWVQFNDHIARARQQPHMGWGRYTTGKVATYDVPGDHMNMVKAPHVQALARAIRACLGH